MEVSKGLVIADPWIDLVLDGSKTWEMRTTRTSHRGWVALIRCGSGTVVGVVQIVDCGNPITKKSEWLATCKYHHGSRAAIRSNPLSRWNIPWHLENVRRLRHPVPYKHKRGAVSWVLLEQSVIDAIKAQLPRKSPFI